MMQLCVDARRYFAIEGRVMLHSHARLMQKIMSQPRLFSLPLLAAVTVLVAGCQSRDERLVEAIYRDEPQSVVDDLLSKGATPDALVSDHGPSALHAAVRKNDLAMVKRLIAAGAQVNTGKSGYAKKGASYDAYGVSYNRPLHVAVINGNLDMVKLLLESGADVNAPGGGVYRERLFSSCKPSAETPLHFAANRGDELMVRFLLSHGAESERVDLSGRTAMDMAAQRGHMNVVKVLWGAVPASQRQERLDRALNCCARSKNANLAKFLLSEGASVQAIGDDGRSPLHNAAIDGDVAMVEVLLAAGGNVNAVENNGATPLFNVVCFKENAEKVAVLRLLLNHGADVKKLDEYGSSPLHIAAWWNNVESVRILMDAGAEASIRTRMRFEGSSANLTPLELAEALGKKQAAQAIREKLAAKK